MDDLIMNIREGALEIHRQKRGKIEVRSKVQVKNREVLTFAYTPGVAEVCRAIQDDPSTIYEYTIRANSVAVITDGSAVLGLGNIGPEAALPVMEGKAMIFREMAGIDAFPICIGTQDTNTIITIIKNISTVFGGINLEDIAKPKCFRILDTLREKAEIPIWHDDQQGTATVTLAGLMNAAKIVGKKKEDIKIDNEGYAHVPQKPGLGMEIDWDSIDGWTIATL
jgi:malate dehydrogenase (oxaloacetate-decarboxylating)